MLMIKDPQDLKTYLETRLKMVQGSRKSAKEGSKSDFHARGVEYAFEEAIKAVDAMLTQQALETKPDNPPKVGVVVTKPTKR